MKGKAPTVSTAWNSTGVGLTSVTFNPQIIIQDKMLAANATSENDNQITPKELP